MSYTVYVLYSQKDKNLYVGCTRDVEKRFRRHQEGQVGATQKRRPLVLIHTEHFSNKSDAFNRERFLKSLWGGREKKRIKLKYLNSVGHKSDHNG